MLKTIRKIYPKAKISILSATPDIDEKYYAQYQAETYNRLFNLIGKNKPKIFSVLTSIMKILWYLLWTKFEMVPIPTKDKNILRLFRETDIVIACGGAYLGGNKFQSIPQDLFPIYLAKKLKKKIYVYAQSVDPISNKLLKLITEFVLNQADIITLREQYSLNLLKSMRIKSPMYLTADPAFLIDKLPFNEGKKLLEKAGYNDFSNQKIGLTVRKWNFPNSTHPKEKFMRYIDEVSQFIEKVTQQENADIILFPQVILKPNDDDRIISNLLKSKLTKKASKKVFVLEEDYTPEQIKSMMGAMDFFIGTRMHSNIFAISMGIPTLAISYEIKTDGIMKMVGLADYVIDISNISSDQIIEKFNNMKKNGDIIKKQLNQMLPIICKEAERNGEFLKMLIEKT